MPSPRAGGRRWAFAAISLVVASWAVLAGRAVLLARDDLDAGMKSVDQVRHHVSPGDLAAGRPVAGLEVARADFTRAHARLNGPVLLGVRYLPVLGRQVRSLAAVSAGAAQVSSIAAEAVRSSQSTMTARSGQLAGESRTILALASVAATAESKLRTVSLGPSHGLLGPTARARNKLADDLAQFQDVLVRGTKGAVALEDLVTGTHRYLVFAANNAEMRAGSGMFLSVGELTTGADGVSLGPMQTVTTIAVPAGVPLSGDLAQRWGWLDPNQEWRNLMTSPRFDVSAQLAAQMWVASGHQPVDGVMAIDAVALQGVLEATGPVSVNGRQIDAENVVDELLNIQYFRYNDNQNDQRREELGQIAGAAFGGLASGGWSRSTLADGLEQAVLGRHIMMWSQSGRDEAGWQALGVDGGLHDNSLLVSVLNRGGNKLDDFLHISSDMTFRPAGKDTEVTLHMTLENQVPPDQPFDVIGPDIHSGVAAGVYLGIVSINMPAGATDGHFDGVDHLAVAGSDGPTQVMAFQLQVDPGQRRTLVAHFTVPGRQGNLRVEPSARFPATKWTYGQDLWHDVAGRSVRWDLAGRTG